MTANKRKPDLEALDKLPYLNATEAAALIRARQRKITRAIEEGELVAADISERPGTGKPRYRIAKSDLLAWLEGRQPKPAGKATRRRRHAKRPAGWVQYV